MFVCKIARLRSCIKNTVQLILASIAVVTLGKLLFGLIVTVTDGFDRPVEISSSGSDPNMLPLGEHLTDELSRELTMDGRSCSYLRTNWINVKGSFVCRQNTSDVPFLTLFTTMTYNEPKLTAFKNTLKLWPQLPETRVVLFLAPSEDYFSSDFVEDTDKLATLACAVGWDVFIAPRCNKYNYPILSSMFLMAESLWPSIWVAYSNADILYTESLLNTLHTLDDDTRIETHFLVGRRRNVELSSKILIRDLDKIEPLLESSKLHVPYAMDYFITRRERFPWHKIPPFVVGRPGYDNWLVQYAIHHNIPSVDITESNPALHQSLIGVTQDHTVFGTDDDNYNAKFFGPWKLGNGNMMCIRYKTVENKMYVDLVERVLEDMKPCAEIRVTNTSEFEVTRTLF